MSVNNEASPEAVSSVRAPDDAQKHQAPLLRVNDLEVSFNYAGAWTPVVKSATFDVRRGEIAGLVGESGSGKTVTAMTTLGLIGPQGGRITGGSIELDGVDVSGLSERQWSNIRGNRVSMIFQQPSRSLNPAFTVGEQIAEVVRRHLDVSRKEAWERAVTMLELVRIARPQERARMYPHQLSGGMCQRAMIASALVCEPELLVADEPTTALDVTVQLRILELLHEIKDRTGIGILFITHDLGVIAQMCDRVAVMYAGEVVERATVSNVFRKPEHPYTLGLLDSIPKRGAERMASIPGRVPPPTNMPAGCRFHPRCEFAVEGRCTTGEPELVSLPDDGSTRCVRHDELNLGRTV